MNITEEDFISSVLNDIGKQKNIIDEAQEQIGRLQDKLQEFIFDEQDRRYEESRRRYER